MKIAVLLSLLAGASALNLGLHKDEEPLETMEDAAPALVLEEGEDQENRELGGYGYGGYGYGGYPGYGGYGYGGYPGYGGYGYGM